MTILTNTTITYGVTSAGGLREDLSDVIYDLFPEDTWALTNLDKETANATYTEWLSQQPAAAAANIGVEGDDATFASLTAPTRYGTYCQIIPKTFIVSDTLEAVTKAGRRSEVARGAIVRMRELKRDAEYALTRNAIATAGNATTGRSTAGMESWIGGVTSNADGTTTANAVRATTTADTCTTPAIASGTAGTAPTDGSTTGTITSTALNQALGGAWAAGGDPSVILAPMNAKDDIDGFTSVATRFVDVNGATQASIIGAANLYVSDYGRHTVILHRYMRSVTVLCIDPNYWAIRFLRQPLKRELAKTGDATKYQMLMEMGLVCRNWHASSKVVGVA